MGYYHEVLPMMQRISHSTRAYIINAEGLPGFLIQIDFMQVLREADAKGRLKDAKKWHQIDLKEIEKKFAGKLDNKTQMNFFKKHYPSVYIFLLYHLNQKDRV